MTREEAINILEEYPCSTGEVDGNTCAVIFDVGLDDVETALDMAISALREQPRWISVDERLPKPDEKVLILCKNGAMFVGKRTYRYSYGEELRWGVFTALGSVKVLNKGRVSHWMPLPEPPKEDTDA